MFPETHILEAQNKIEAECQGNYNSQLGNGLTGRFTWVYLGKHRAGLIHWGLLSSKSVKNCCLCNVLRGKQTKFHHSGQPSLVCLSNILALACIFNKPAFPWQLVPSRFTCTTLFNVVFLPADSFTKPTCSHQEKHLDVKCNSCQFRSLYRHPAGIRLTEKSVFSTGQIRNK